MNDTEKIDELMEELDNIEKENEDAVPVITKEYNIGDEEPTTEQEKTKIMEEIQENIEQTPEEEPKQEEPEITPLPDKDKKKKKLMIILIAATVALIIAIILLSIFVHPKKDKGKSVAKNDTISYEDYKKVITDYGDAVTAAFKELRTKNPHVTNVQIEDLDIEYKEHDVKCKDVHFNNDKTVYLNDCQIKGYNNQFKFHYGEKETEDNKYKIYVYKAKDSNYYDSTMDKDIFDEYIERRGKENVEIVKEIICKTEECKFLTPWEDEKRIHYILEDDGKTYLCNFKNDTKTQLRNLSLSKNDYYIGKFIYNKNDLRLITMSKNDLTTHKTYLGLYSVTKDKMLYEPQFDTYMPKTDNLTKRGYIAFKIEGQEKSTMYIINANTGEKIKEIEVPGNNIDIEDFDEGREQYIIHYKDHEMYYLDIGFNKVEIKTDPPKENTETTNKENTENTENSETTNKE